MKTLEQIDRTKMQLQAAKQALHEADNWTVLATDLEEVSNEYWKVLREKIFFFHWRYSPLWALACRTIPLPFSVSITSSVHILTPSTGRSLSTSSLHPSSLSCPFQFLSEDLFGHPILLHFLQVTQPTYPLPLYAFYYIFSFTQLFQFSIRPTFPPYSFARLS
jgi:hypothetical protein